eukprot:XP_011660464.1 PREDICTED: UDP-D-xylose:L-fucose alpha-1,3-D-xylosyltransferase 1-like isoform X2 [Strongylocentrotus purpuratus]
MLKLILLLLFSIALLGVTIKDFVALPVFDILSVWNERSVIRVPYKPNASRWTSETIRKDTKKNGTEIFDRARPWTILSSTNAAYLDFCDNWLESVKRCGITHHITIFTEDLASYNYLNKRTDIDISVQRPPETKTSTKFLEFGTDEYIKMINRRPRYIRSFLEQGIDVLFSDLDTVWLENPLLFCPEGYDLHVVEDMHKEYVYIIAPDWLEINMGFVYFSATNATLEVIRKWDDMLTQYPKTPDQDLLNALLERKNVRDKLEINVMDYQRFPNGWQYFNDKWRRRHRDVQTVVVHNDYLHGHDPKIKRFKRIGLWYV